MFKFCVTDMSDEACRTETRNIEDSVKLYRTSVDGLQVHRMKLQSSRRLLRSKAKEGLGLPENKTTQQAAPLHIPFKVDPDRGYEDPPSILDANVATMIPLTG